MSDALISGICLGQIDLTVGDIQGNLARIRAAWSEAERAGAELLVLPELAICGYPPEDLLLRPSFVEACMSAVAELAAESAGRSTALVIGSPWEQQGWLYNAALLIDDGHIRHIQPKRMLPNYGIFDEKRVFVPGEASRTVKWRGRTLGLMICEDMWYEHVAADLGKAGAELLIVINASPFESEKLAHRHEVAEVASRAAGAPLVYVNLVGAQDDVVFDGGSFVLNPQKILAQLPEFTECTVCLPAAVAPILSHEESLWRALATGLGAYVRKNGFPGVLLGLSGGIDSALAAVLAVDALGAERVLGILMPSPHTSQESNEQAAALARNLGISTHTVPITHAMESFAGALSAPLAALAPNLPNWAERLEVGGNLQSRLRGLTLMAISNATGRLVLATSNKSECAVGYATLYGDTCSAYAPLKDVYKTQVYALAQWRSAQGTSIPPRTITRAPTAELAPGQKDEDQLPPYALLDAILVRLIEGRRSASEIIEEGFDAETVRRVAKLVRLNEYKRRQMPPGAKVSPMIFGREWRYPLTNGFSF